MNRFFLIFLYDFVWRLLWIICNLHRTLLRWWIITFIKNIGCDSVLDLHEIESYLSVYLIFFHLINFLLYYFKISICVSYWNLFNLYLIILWSDIIWYLLIFYRTFEKLFKILRVLDLISNNSFIFLMKICNYWKIWIAFKTFFNGGSLFFYLCLTLKVRRLASHVLLTFLEDMVGTITLVVLNLCTLELHIKEF